MGKQSRKKKEASQIPLETKKLLKKLIKEAESECFEVNGKKQVFNPLKKFLNGEVYKTAEGMEITRQMLLSYKKLLEKSASV